MVIDPNNPNIGRNTHVSHGYGKVKSLASATTQPNMATNTKSGQPDNVSLSQHAKTLGKLEQASRQHSGVDEAKVASLKQAIADGSYKINSDQIAKNMLDHEQLL